MEMREAITEKLLKNIIKDLRDGISGNNSVNIFSEFIKALALESDMLGMHKGKIVAEIAASALRVVNVSSWINAERLNANQANLANEYAKELAILFQSSGDQSEALKKLSSKIKKAGLRLDTI